MKAIAVRDFEDWREKARALLVLGVEPGDIGFVDQGAEQNELPFQDNGWAERPGHAATTRVPREFVELAEAVACHRDESRWDRLYRVLWRLTNGHEHLLEITV